jgi:outer membrane protein assembly factor BamD
MKRSVASIVLVFCAALLSGCGIFETPDKTAGWSAQQLYNEAKFEMDSQNYSGAIEYYEKLETRYPFGRFAQQAQMDVAYSYWKQGEYESAVAACDRFVKLYPNHPNLDYIHYLKGLVYFSQDMGFLGRIFEQDQSERDPKAMRDAFDTFKDLVARFPNSKYAPDAAARMRYLVNTLSAHEVHVARYYLKREAFVAASMRAKHAVENYPQTPAIEEALFIMVKSYDAMGMTDLRNAANSVLIKNFPNSAYLKGDGNRSSEWWKLWK